MITPTTAGRYRRRLLVSAVAACLLIAPVVSGCSLSPVESAIEGLTGGNVDIGGASVPDDFPAEVPLIDGDVVSGFAVGTPPEKVWNVTIKVSDASALDTINREMEAAGFSSQVGDAAIGGLTGAMYSDGTYSVLVLVAEDGDGGWAATYTVTPVAE